MGTHLWELRKKQPKLKDGKSVKGSKHRLTDKTLDKLQTYYGNAISANVKPGKLTPQEQKKQIKIMQKAILAVLYHTCEYSDDKKRHQYCPPGPDSWCSYKRDGTLLRKDHHLDAVNSHKRKGIDLKDNEPKKVSCESQFYIHVATSSSNDRHL